jgi:hypothetical protein
MFMTSQDFSEKPPAPDPRTYTQAIVNRCETAQNIPRMSEATTRKPQRVLDSIEHFRAPRVA